MANNLITVANLLSAIDKIGNSWFLLNNFLTQSTVSPVTVNTPTNALSNLLTTYAALNNAVQEVALLSTNSVQNGIGKVCADQIAPAYAGALIADLSRHCTVSGVGVAASIVDLNTFLSYYNGGSGGNKFANPATYEFGYLYNLISGTLLSYPNAMWESVNSLWNSTLYPNGFGKCTFNNTFTAGYTGLTGTWAEPLPIVQVTTSFSSGSAAPIITVTGTDDTGSGATTWTYTFGSSNPSASISQQTISSGALTGQTVTTATVGSTAGIVPGSIITINKNKADQEIVPVRAVPSGITLTFACNQSHNASATIDANTSGTLVSTPSGRRIRTVSGITCGGSGGWAAGVVQVAGGADRLGV
jgi:hypothetical protein